VRAPVFRRPESSWRRRFNADSARKLQHRIFVFRIIG
jgi:hypothetical protein